VEAAHNNILHITARGQKCLNLVQLCVRIESFLNEKKSITFD
jgi:hypothetical protein